MAEFIPNLSGLFRVHFKVGWDGGKIIPFPSPCLKLVIINLEIKIWYVSTYAYVVSENIPFSTWSLLILVM